MSNKFIVSKQKINLGLDLKGGSHLVLQVDLKSYCNAKLHVFSNEIKDFLNHKRVGYQRIYVEENKLIIISQDREFNFANSIVDSFKNVRVDMHNDNIIISYNNAYLDKLYNSVLDESLDNVQRRLDNLGTKEIVLQRLGKDRMLLQVPGIQDIEQIKSLLGRTAKLTFHLADVMSVSKNINPLTTELMTDEYGNSYPVFRKIEISGDSVINVSVDIGSFGKPIVRFKLNNAASKRLAKITQENINKPLVIVLDNKVLTAPLIKEPILGGQGDISGNFDFNTAQELAIALKSGALPAPLYIVEEKIIGPGLGEESIFYGKIAVSLSVVLVSIFMIIFYGLLGIFADISLIFNIMFIFSIMTLLQSTLTLSGLAGIALTVGMSVDANVLIFERIKEEIKLKNKILRSVDRGFRNAMLTIIDSNVTTLICAFIMFTLGSGPISGFAITLTVGILCSMFSSITLTKLFIDLWLKFCQPKSLLGYATVS